MTPFTKTPIDTGPALAALEAHPELWNVYSLRTKAYVHSQVSDIWLRYRDIADLKHRTPAKFVDQEHECVWYPGWEVLKPALIPLVFGLANAILATRIGGILITKVPAGLRVGPHKDLGFNARHYRKFCICLQANEGQSFEFDREKMLTSNGDVFEFDNLFEHWVENQTEQDRLSLIVSLRTQ